MIDFIEILRVQAEESAHKFHHCTPEWWEAWLDNLLSADVGETCLILKADFKALGQLIQHNLS